MDNHRIVVARRGGPEVLEFLAEPMPVPGPGEARIRMEAAGVSAYDLMLRKHRFPGFPKVPFSPGVDIVGIVDETGPGVTSVESGTRVAASTGLAGGGYAEYLCLPATELVPVSPEIDPAEAVCLVANYLTATLAMHETAHVGAGEKILVQGAAGGVGTALLELGSLAGLEMFGTASAPKHHVVRELGAVPIDYRSEDVVARVHELTNDGVDVVFDPIGGARQLLNSYRCLRSGGRLVWFGVAASSRRGIGVIPSSLVTRQLLAVIPDGKHAPLMMNAGKLSVDENTWYRTTLSELIDHLRAGKIHPVVFDRIPLAEAARAHQLLESGAANGKVVLTG